MNLLKTSVLTLVATLVKLLVGIIINKAVSIFIGPTGIALIGQFQNSSQLITTVAQGGVNAGVTKYTAEYGRSHEELPQLWSTAAIIVLSCSIIVGLTLISFSYYLSNYILKSHQYNYVFVIFGFTLVFFTFNQLLLSILNGLKEIRVFIEVNITQSLVSLIFTIALIFLFGMDGVLIALVTNQSVIFFIIVYRLSKSPNFSFKKFTQGFNLCHGKKLSAYSAMALTSACTVPLSLFFIRNYIGENLSWSDAGYWQSMWYISTMYLMVVTTALSTYYLPRLSEISCKFELRRELKNGYLIIIPIVVILSFFIYALREFIVLILFSDEFRPMLALFKWQLVGDVIKIASWLSGFLLVAKASVKLTIFSEVFFSFSFVLLSIVLIEMYGLVGVTYAYISNYMFHLFFMLHFTRKRILY